MVVYFAVGRMTDTYDMYVLNKLRHPLLNTTEHGALMQTIFYIDVRDINVSHDGARNPQFDFREPGEC